MESLNINMTEQQGSDNEKIHLFQTVNKKNIHSLQTNQSKHPEFDDL